MSKLTEQELEAIRKEAEALYPQGIAVGDIDLKPLVVDTHIAAVTAERERAKDETAGAPEDGGETWQMAFKRMKDENSFDDKYDIRTLSFAYAFQNGFKAAKKSPTYHAEFVEWTSHNALYRGNGVWDYNVFDQAVEDRTTAELFSIYQQSKSNTDAK